VEAAPSDAAEVKGRPSTTLTSAAETQLDAIFDGFEAPVSGAPPDPSTLAERSVDAASSPPETTASPAADSQSLEADGLEAAPLTSQPAPTQTAPGQDLKSPSGPNESAATSSEFAVQSDQDDWYTAEQVTTLTAALPPPEAHAAAEASPAVAPATQGLDAASVDEEAELTGAAAQLQSLPSPPPAPGINLIGTANWEEQGPGAVLDGRNVEGIPGTPLIGAIQAVAIHPFNPNIVFIGSVNGGIWRTTNARFPTDGLDNDGNLIRDGADPDGNGIINTPDPAEAVHWEPVTDQQVSLSITDIVFSPLDADGQPISAATPADKFVLYAGLGSLSSLSRLGGLVSGLLRSTDGGQTWQHIGGGNWDGTQIAKVIATPHRPANGQILLVATREARQGNTHPNLGLWASADGGQSFGQTSGLTLPNWLPAGAVTDILLDPNNNLSLYVAVRQQGIFQGTLAPGSFFLFSNFTPLNPGLPAAANFGRALLAAHDSDGPGANAGPTILYTAVVRQPGGGATAQLIDVFRFNNGTRQWQPLDPAGPPSTAEAGNPGLHPGHQGEKDLSFVADPNDPDVVYVGGDTQPVAGAGNASLANDFSARIFRGDFTPAAGTPVWEPVVAGYANGTSPHADSRRLAFDSDGSLLEVDDGGIYRLRNPSARSILAGVPGAPTVAGNRQWISLNGDLRITEFWQVAWDPVNDLVIGGAQDNGSIDQFDRVNNDGDAQTDEPDERWFWLARRGGDGLVAAVEVLSNTRVWRYRMANSFSGFFRDLYDNNNHLLQTVAVQLRAPGNATNLSGLQAADNPGNFPTVTLNAVDARRLLLGRVGLYETTGPNRGQFIRDLTASLDTPPAGRFSALVYGGRNADGTSNRGVIYAAAGNRVYVRPSATAAFRSVALGLGAAGTVLDIAVDPTDWRRAFAVTSNQVFQTTDGGMIWNDITGNLTGANVGLLSIAYIDAGIQPAAGPTPSRPANNVLLVGGTGGVYRTFDPNNTAARWSEFGRNLPNALVHDIAYDRSDDVLLVSSLGRGAWLVRNAAAVLDDADVLQIVGDATANAADVLGLIRDAANPTLLNVFLNNSGATPDLQIPLASLRRIEFLGGGGDDLLYLNTANGVINVATVIDFKGGAGTDTLIIDDDTGATGKPFHVDNDTLVSRDGELMLVVGDSVEVFQDSTTPRATATLGDGLQHTGRWATALAGEEVSGQTLPLLGGSLGRALGNGLVTRGQREPLPTEVTALELVSLDGTALSLFQRLFETGTGAFLIRQIGTQLTDPAAIRAKLDGLDGTPGNVTLAQVGSALRYDVRIVKPLTGTADLDLDALDGLINLNGTVRISADVSLHVVLGVDATGFYIDPTAFAEPELVVSNLRIEGSAADERISGHGRFGFLEVELTDGELRLDPDVRLEVDLLAPGPGPITRSDDGKIRVDHLASGKLGLVKTALRGDPAGNDLTFTGTFEASAVVPGRDAPLPLGGARVSLIWPDVTTLENVQVAADLQAGRDLLEFLNAATVHVTEALTTLATVLDAASEFELLGAPMPLLNQSLGELLRGVPLPVIYQGAEIAEVDDPLDEGAVRTFTVILESAAALRDGIKIGDAVEYRGTDGGFHDGVLSAVSPGQFTVRISAAASPAPDRDAPVFRFHRGGKLSDQIQGMLGDLLDPAHGAARVPTLQSLVRELARLLGVDPVAIDLRVTGRGEDRAIEFTLAFDPAPLTFSEALDFGATVSGLELTSGGEVNVVIDPQFAVRLGVRLGAGLAVPDRIYLVETDAPEVTMDVALQLDDPTLVGKLGFLGVQLREQAAVANNQGIRVTGRFTLNLADPDPDDARLDLADVTAATVSDVVDFGVDVRFDIDGLEIVALAGVAVGALRLSLDGDSGPTAPGRVRSLADLRALPDRVQMTGVEDFLTFNSLSPQALLGLLRQLADWLEGASASPVLAQQIPFTGATLGEVVHVATSFSRQVTGLLDRIRAVAAKDLPPDGKLAEDLAFRLRLNDATNVAVSVSRSATADNTRAKDLLADLQAALAPALEAAGQTGKVQAALNGRALSFRTLDQTVTSLRVEGAQALGFLAEQSGVTPVFDTVQELLAEVAAFVGAQYDPLTRRLTFRLNLAEQPETPIEVPIVFDLDLSPLAELQSNSVVTLRPKVSGRLTFGIELGPLGGDFQITDATTLASLNGGRGVEIQPGVADLKITLGDGSEFQVNLDGVTTIGAVRAAIRNGTQQQVDVQLHPDGQRLRLVDKTGGAIADFAVAALNGSFAGLGLGLLGTEEDASGRIDGAPLHGERLADRFFIDADAELVAAVDLIANDLEAAARLGFLGIGIFGGTGTANVGARVRLNEPGTNRDGRITLSELLNGLSDPASLMEASLFGSAAFNLPLRVEPDILGDEQPQEPALVISWPDLTAGAPSVTLQGDIDVVEGLRQLAFAQLLAMLQRLQGLLEQVERTGPLQTRLPLIDRSLRDLVGLSDQFGALIDRLEAQPPRTIQEFETIVSEVVAEQFSFAGGGAFGPGLETSFAGGLLQLDLKLGLGIDRTLPVHLDLAALGVPGGDSLVSVDASGEVAFQAEAAITLGLQIDLTNPTEPGFFLKDTSGIRLHAQVSTPQPLDFTAAVAVLSLHVRGATIELNDGAATPGPARWTIAVADAPGRPWAIDMICSPACRPSASRNWSAARAPCCRCSSPPRRPRWAARPATPTATACRTISSSSRSPISPTFPARSASWRRTWPRSSLGLI
jgi:hypothetical protein